MTASRGIRARRSDVGTVRPTGRDVAVLRWLNEMYGAPLSVVADLYGVGPRAARRQAARLEQAGSPSGRVGNAGTAAAPECGSPTGSWASRGRRIGIEVELHRKAAHRYEGILADLDPDLAECWWFVGGPDVAWLGRVLADIPCATPQRVVELPVGVAR